MPDRTPAPLSPTVHTVFDQFLQKLKEEKVLSAAALEAFGLSLKAQKLDHDTLRDALFNPEQAPK